jgi:hypothetical protein
MRIGLVLFGHLRSFRSAHDSYKSFLNILQQVGDVDVFCHTWDIEESVTASWWKEHKPEDPPSATVNAKEIEEKYRPVKYIIEPSRHFDDSTYNVNSSIPVAGILSMLYTQRKAFDLLKEYESQNGFLYDVVVKARYDLLFEVTPVFPLIVQRSAQEKCIFLPTSNPYEQLGSFSDVFAVGHRQLMEEYFEFYPNFPEALDAYQQMGYRQFLPELCLTLYLRQKGFLINELSELRIHILRKNGDKFQINTDKNFTENNPHFFHHKTRNKVNEILPPHSDITNKNTKHIVKKYISWIYPGATNDLLDEYVNFFEGGKISFNKVSVLAKKTKTSNLFMPFIMRDFFETAFRRSHFGIVKKLFLASLLMRHTNYGMFYFRVLKSATR